MQIVLIGPPGAGKGTQAARISQRLAIPHLSTGDMLRLAIEEGSDIGHAAKQYMKAGTLVPDELILKIVDDRLAHDDCRAGSLFDGFPRTISQAEALDRTLEEQGRKLDCVLEIVVPEEALLERLAARARTDDQPEVIRNRLQSFENDTQPIIEYYRSSGRLTIIDGMGTPDEVFDRIMKVLEPDSA